MLNQIKNRSQTEVIFHFLAGLQIVLITSLYFLLDYLFNLQITKEILKKIEK